MPKGKEDLRVVRTRKLLSATLLELMQEKPIEKISVIELCDAAMINRATFYAHFEDKYHLLDFALEELKDSLYANFTLKNKLKTPDETIKAIMTMGADFVFDNRHYITKMLKAGRDGGVVYTISDSIANSIKYQLGKFKQTYDFAIPATVISKFVAGGMMSVALAVLDDPDKYDYPAVTAMIARSDFAPLFIKKEN